MLGRKNSKFVILTKDKSEECLNSEKEFASHRR